MRLKRYRSARCIRSTRWAMSRWRPCRGSSDHSAGRVRGDYGAIGQRQDHADEYDRLLDTPTRGSYRLDGTEVAQLPQDDLALVRARKLGFVFQQYMLMPRLTAERNVEMPLIYR